MTGSPWVSDDWEDQEQEQQSMPEFPAASDTGHDGPGADESTGTPLPFMDAEVADELAQEPLPPWFGLRWREIDPEHQVAAWNGLRRWVDWFVAEYRLSTAVVPSCWYLHPNITAELYAAMCMEYKVWEEQAPGLGPMMLWHAHLEMMTSRLRRMGEEAGCENSGGHKEPEAFAGRAAFELAYDEDAWLAHTATTRERETIARPTDGVQYLRAAVVNADGETVTTSNPVGMKARRAGEVTAGLTITSAAVDEIELQVAVTGGRDDVFVQWEESDDGASWHVLGENEAEHTTEETSKNNFHPSAETSTDTEDPDNTQKTT